MCVSKAQTHLLFIISLSLSSNKMCLMLANYFDMSVRRNILLEICLQNLLLSSKQERQSNFIIFYSIYIVSYTVQQIRRHHNFSTVTPILQY